jgi:5-bromo-4-chloroindolyl phosphate hydrolysis protein
MTEQERSAQMNQLQKQASEMQSQMNAMQNQMSKLEQKLKDPNLSESERKALEKQLSEMKKSMSDLEKQMQQNKEMTESLKLSKEAQEVFQKMTNNPLYKKLQELAKKLAENAEAAEKTGQAKLTKEQLEEMQKQLEELAKQLKDDKAMDAYLQALIDAMKEGKQMGENGLIGAGLKSAFRLPGSPRGVPTQDEWMGDSGQINKLDKEEAGGGKTTPTMATGQRKEGKGQETYVEIKAPTMVGTRSSVPYTQVLPSYKKKAESALDRKEIPKEHQKRVKEYFESLTGK